MFDVSIVAPLYNEEATFPHLIQRLNTLMDSLDLRIEIVLIDDGSRDNTPLLMNELALSDNRYNAVFLSRNYGHQVALTAGFSAARGSQAVMVIDGDLQDPPELLSLFYSRLQQGYDIAYAVRQKRTEGWLKRTAYFLFYRFLGSISSIKIPLDSGDFAMLSRRTVDVLNAMPEESRYLRGMRSWIGFRQIGIPYERDERVAGEAKYSFKMLWRLAYNGIFNFSDYPIKFITRLGVGTSSLAITYLIYNVIRKFVYGDVPQGFTATIFLITLFSGVQLVALGIIGEYVLRIFFQVKGRPLFLVRDQIKDCELTHTAILKPTQTA
ncbi:MAG: glycosyltransferase [Cytophagaceae bacterium]|nr:MAG: glycosyltransferase [Cytophagaceae bacterium]